MMGHRQQMTDKQRLEWDCNYYKARLEANQGSNYEYYSEKKEEVWISKGYRWYNIPKYPNKPEREDVKIATKSEYHAKEIVEELRATGHYARIICGVSKNVQKIKMFSILYKKKV